MLEHQGTIVVPCPRIRPMSWMLAEWTMKETQICRREINVLDLPTLSVAHLSLTIFELPMIHCNMLTNAGLKSAVAATSTTLHVLHHCIC